MATCGPGTALLVARNCHLAAFSALVLSGNAKGPCIRLNKCVYVCMPLEVNQIVSNCQYASAQSDLGKVQLQNLLKDLRH